MCGCCVLCENSKIIINLSFDDNNGIHFNDARQNLRQSKSVSWFSLFTMNLQYTIVRTIHILYAVFTVQFQLLLYVIFSSTKHSSKNMTNWFLFFFFFYLWVEFGPFLAEQKSVQMSLYYMCKCIEWIVHDFRFGRMKK